MQCFRLVVARSLVGRRRGRQRQALADEKRIVGREDEEVSLKKERMTFMLELL